MTMQKLLTLRVKQSNSMMAIKSKQLFNFYFITLKDQIYKY